jgi:hypothetical protein
MAICGGGFLGERGATEGGGENEEKPSATRCSGTRTAEACGVPDRFGSFPFGGSFYSSPLANVFSIVRKLCKGIRTRNFLQEEGLGSRGGKRIDFFFWAEGPKCLKPGLERAPRAPAARCRGRRNSQGDQSVPSMSPKKISIHADEWSCGRMIA